MKLNAHEVIESYVTDVALQLPRKQRNDVAFELRALINEGLQDKAEESGRVADADMAVEFLRAFGRPEDVAARYRPTLNIIDPSDGHRFLRLSIIGLAIVWFVGLLECLQQPINSGWDWLNVIGQWWTSKVIPSLWWPGLLVVGFGLSSLVAQRWPQTSEWKPRAGDSIHGGRTALVMGVIGILCGLFLLLDPRWILDFFWGGNAAPVAYRALTYTDTFLQGPAPWLFALLALNIPLYIAAIIKGRWSVLLRRIETAGCLATCAVMLWAIVDGPILMTSSSDGMAKLLMVLILAFTLIIMGIEKYRSVRPTPNQQIQSS